MTASSLVEPPAIATPRASQDETDEETGTREARRNSTKESCQQAHTYSVHDRRRDANKGGTPIKSNIRGQGNPEPQPPQTTPDRAHHHKKSKARPEPTERPTKRPSDRPGGDIPCRSAPSAAARARRRSSSRALRRLRRLPRRQPAVSATARACPLLQTRPHPPLRPRAAASAAARDSAMVLASSTSPRICIYFG